jgi:hypothetical protein
MMKKIPRFIPVPRDIEKERNELMREKRKIEYREKG